MTRNPFTPTTFSTDAPELHSLTCHHSPTMVFVTVDSAPVWWEGEIVARISGEFPAARFGKFPTSYAYVVLLDNGALSGLQDWRVESIRE